MDELPQADDAATKFLFDLSFDEEAGDEEELESVQVVEPDIPPPPPEPTYSEADLNAARSQAFEEGHAAGLNEAGAGIEQRASAALETVAANLALLGERQDDANRNVLIDVITLNRRILEMLIPAYLERHGPDEIDALVSECLTRILDPGATVVELPADIAEPLEPRLRETAARIGFTGTLEIRAAPDLTAGDVRLSWQNGGAARLGEELWTEISEAVDRAIHSLDGAGEPAPDTAEPTADAAEPAADTAEPAADTAEPAADTAEPAADTAEPSVRTTEPQGDTAASGGAADPSMESEDDAPRPEDASPDAQAERGAG